MASAEITVNGVAGSDIDLPINTLVQLNNNGTGGELTYAWVISYQPPGAADALSSAVIVNPTFTPKKEGTYLIQLVVNAGLGTQVADAIVCRVLQLKTQIAVPAVGETVESTSSGWAEPAVNEVLRLVDDMRADPAIMVCQLAYISAVNDVVRFVGVATLKSGLPGEEDILTVDEALATTASHMGSVLGVVVGPVVSGGPLTSGALAYVRILGLVQGITSAGAVGDPVYVSDTGTISNVAGTNLRLCGRIVAANLGVIDVAFSGEYGVTLQTAYDGGPGITLGAGGPVTINTPVDKQDILILRDEGVAVLTINQNGSVSTSAYFQVAGGSAASPGLKLEADTGAYLIGVGVLGFATSGSERMRLSINNVTTTVPILAAGGAEAAPDFAFSADIDTGMFSGGANTLAFSTNGVQRLSIGTGFITSALSINGPAGTPTDPTFSPVSLGGMFSNGVNDVSFSTNATMRLSITTTAITSTIPIIVPAGTAAAPTLVLETAGLGFYRQSVTNLGLAEGGATMFGFDATGPTLHFYRNNTTIIANVSHGYLNISGTISTSDAAPVVLKNNGSFTGAAGALQKGVQLVHTLNQTLTAAFTALQINTTQTAVGTGNQLAIDFMIGGVSQGHITSAGLIRSANGSAGAPAYSFIGATTQGMYNLGGGLLGWSTAGVLRMYLQSTGLFFSGAAGALTQGTADNGLTIGGLIATSSNASITFANGGNSFTGGAGVSQIGVRVAHTINQTLTAAFTALQIDTTQTAAGSGNQLAIDFMIGGVSQGRITSSALLQVAAGTAGAPSHSFLSYPTTGAYATGVTQYRISLNANLTYTFDGTGLLLEQTGLVIRPSAVNASAQLSGNWTTGSGGPWTFTNINAFSGGAGVSQYAYRIVATVNQSSTAGFTALEFAITETALGTGSQYIIRARGGAAGTTERFSVSSDGGIATAQISPAAMAVTENDYAGFANSSFGRATPNAANTVVTGILAPTNSNDARWLIIVNLGAGTLTVNNQDAGSTANNRVITTTGAAVVLAALASIHLIYDPTSARWRQV